MAEEEALGVFAVAAAVLIDDDSDEDYDEQIVGGPRRERRRRIIPIHVNVNDYRNLPDQTFKEHFRMNRALFEILIVMFGNHLERRNRLHRLRTPLDVIAMMSLWILATQDTFRSVAVKFSVPSRGTVHYHYVIFIEALREMAPMFIQWPNAFERDNIKASFEMRYGYPGVVGCLDGTHIYLSAPLVQHERYVNRFKKYSILLQGVCDHEKVFRDIYVGQPGSVHDARMFQRSPLSHNLLHNGEMLSDGEHILGDGAYTLTDKVITPYRNVGNISRRQRRHNFVHASTRSIIERTFGLDKGCWRRQKLMLAYSLEYVVDTVVASCVLHNFLLLDGQPYVNQNENPDPLIAEVAPEINANPAQNVVLLPDNDPILLRAKQAGRAKRDFISYQIHPYDD